MAGSIKNVVTQQRVLEDPHFGIDPFECQFNDSSVFELDLPNVSHCEFKSWTQDEKSTILALVSRLRQLSPGLLQLASVGSPIVLLRVGKLVLVDKTEPVAYSGERTILVPDSFFFSYGQILSFAHEVTHIADDMYLAAFSRPWLEIAAPVLWAYSVNPKIIEEESFLSERWPSQYACQSVIEALAEYVAAFVNGRFFSSRAQFEETVAPLITSPSPVVMEWKALVAKARQAKRDRNYFQARFNYTEASKLLPESPCTYFQLAGVAAVQAGYDEVLENTERMIEAFESADSCDLLRPFMLDDIGLIFRTYIRTHDSSGAEKYLQWLVKRFPHDDAIAKLVL